MSNGLLKLHGKNNLVEFNPKIVHDHVIDKSKEKKRPITLIDESSVSVHWVI